MMYLAVGQSKKGFTLIEVLVVTAIIGILASILTLNYMEARQVARDKVRMSTLKEVQVALQLYKAQNGRYPEAGCGVTDPRWAGSESDYTGHPSVTPCAGNYIVGLVPKYIATLPSEEGPVRERKGYAYRVSSDGSAYKIIAHHGVEKFFITGYQDEFARFPLSTCVSPYPPTELDVYSVYSKGAECW